MPNPTVRASGAPTWTRCSASIAQCAGIANAGSDATAMGRAGHRAMELFLAGEEPKPLQLSAAYGIDEKQEREVIEAAAAMLESLDTATWRAQTEVAFKREYPHATLSGHADRVSYDSATRTIAVEDWKFGFRDVEEPDENPQMHAYAVLAWHALLAGDHALIYSPIHDPKPERIVIRIGYPRKRRWSDAAFFTPEQIEGIDAGFAQLFSDHNDNPTDYRTGKHCAGCAALLSCPAIHRDVIPVATCDSEPVPLRDQTPEQQGQAIALAKIVERWSDNILAQARLIADERGSVALPDGSSFTRCTVRRRSVRLDRPGVIDFVREQMGDELFLSSLDLAIGTLEDAAASKARGGKKRFASGKRQEWEQAWREQLAAIDAVEVKTSPAYRITTRKDTKPHDEE